ncbi:aspartate aminotransferase family protein [Streptomyces sp. AK02-01A]|uniref:aspartate aminotransferase family protein n=1 Tax=Streptomyces sp. AK02-01A TaxID=3028648 RepID=UPI0029A413C5|nr:aminotransferase class III-fold pyridoxal phosphate-dependent enzyme [Streptomyces sp. AK02-01A]MDX3853674.1 aminotransferase class III-fold pyridoxal phosphate-dependent enzyme [Streptomyces sp. AK02-01A]
MDHTDSVSLEPESAEPELAEPYLREVLGTAGLAVEYVRAENNTLFRLGEDGAEIPVVDYAGGYGSVLLGHNHPAIIGRATELLAAGTPVHAQFSRHPYANRLAAELNRIIHRELRTDEAYFAIFANTGAEAVEAAVKHAELDRVMRLAALREELATRLERAREAVADGTAVVAAGAYTRLGITSGGGFDPLAAELTRRNTEQLSRPPLFLSLEGGFHGKLAASVQLTHNEAYRAPFKSLAAQARFVPRERPEALKEIYAEERRVVWDVSVSDGRVEVAEREFPAFCAFLVEPIQGEGGIHVLSAEFAAEIQRFCETIDCPLVIDEIQSGMGRTGTLLASSRLGLRGDYYTLAKTLGGGIAKTSVMLVRRARYRKEFEIVHSSTFAKDSFSCHIALKVLELLEADGGAAYRRAVERGEALRAALTSVREDFPEVVKEIRGKGLMLGMEFHDQSGSSSPILRDAAGGGLFGYVLAGHLLRRHNIRTFPTASALNTLRFEPSLQVSDAQIAQLVDGLRDICGILRDHAGERLTGAPVR